MNLPIGEVSNGEGSERQAISEGSKGECMGEAKFVDVNKKRINARTVY